MKPAAVDANFKPGEPPTVRLHYFYLNDLVSRDAPAAGTSSRQAFDAKLAEVYGFIWAGLDCLSGVEEAFFGHRGWSKRAHACELFAAYVKSGMLRPNDVDPVAKTYPLERAVMNADLDFAAMLLEHGADETLLPGDDAKRSPGHRLYVTGVDDIIQLHCKDSVQAEMRALLRRHAMARRVAATASPASNATAPSPARPVVAPGRRSIRV